MDPIARAQVLKILTDMTPTTTIMNQSLESSNQRSMKRGAPSSEQLSTAQPLVQPYIMCGLQPATIKEHQYLDFPHLSGSQV